MRDDQMSITECALPPTRNETRDFEKQKKIICVGAEFLFVVRRRRRRMKKFEKLNKQEVTRDLIRREKDEVVQRKNPSS